MKHTVLHEMFAHDMGAKMTHFHDFELPLHFSAGIIKEHITVRNSVGLFDVSHMGRVIISGEKATEYLDYLLTNDVKRMEVGQLIYSLMCYPNGTVVDDVILYRLERETYYIVLNSSNIQKDLAWITEDNPHKGESRDITVQEISDRTSQFALQGPLSASVLEYLEVNTSSIERFTVHNVLIDNDLHVMISRNGYTGEDGFELYVDNAQAKQLYLLLLNTGERYSLLPCGLGARDTLRLEAKLPLYGHEISENITPYEANLGAFVKINKDDFCGKRSLMKEKSEGIERSLRGFIMVDRSVPRHGYRVYLGAECIGEVTSGMKSPSLGFFGGLMLIKRDLKLKFDDTIEIEIHGKLKKARIARTPFYKKS